MALTATETNTDGPLFVRVTASGGDVFTDYHWVKTVPATVNAVVTSFASGMLNQIADTVLRRTYASARASGTGDTLVSQGRNLMGAIAKLVNAVDRNPAQDTQLRIFHEDDNTLFFTQTATTNPSAASIVGLDTD